MADRSRRLNVSLCAALGMALVSLSSLAMEARVMGPETDSATANTQEALHQVTVRALSPDTVLFTVTREFRPIVPGGAIALNCDDVTITDGSVVTSFAVRSDGSWRQSHLRPYGIAPSEKGNAQRPWASLHWSGGMYSPCLEVPEYPARQPLQVRYEIWARAELTEHKALWKYCDHEDTEDAKVSSEFSIYSLSPELTVHRETDPDSPPCVVIERALPTPTRLTARYGRYYLGNVWWWRIESAWPVSLPAPKIRQQGPVVFVLDSSRSQLVANGFAQQLQAVKALLKQLKSTNIEVILVNRFARRVFGHFMASTDVTSEALSALATEPLGNGSFLDRGLELAVQTLRTQGKPGRIIAMGDGQLRSHFNVAATLRGLRGAPKGTIVHLLQPMSGETNHIELIDPNREFDSPFMEMGAHQLATALHGGVYYVTVSTSSDSNDPPLERLLSAALLGNAIEPRTWQHMTLLDSSRPGQHEWPNRELWLSGKPAGYSDAPSGTYHPSYLDVLTSPDSEESVASKNEVPAGARQVWSGFTRERPPARLTLRGQALGRSVQVELEPDREFEAQLPRLANSQPDVLRCLAEPHHNRYALGAGFLAPTFEFWVPGTNNDEGVGEINSGSGDDWCDSNTLGGWGHSKLVPDAPFPDITALIKPCGLTLSEGGQFTATVETRKSEILDVIATGPVPTKRACLEEAIWSLLLPNGFHKGLPATHTLSFAEAN